jgi:hypothetical protein
MKFAVSAAVLAALAVGVPTAVGKPSSSSISIGASQKSVAFGFSTVVSGHVAGNKAPGALVTLQAKPFGANSYTNVQSTAASSSGSYSFTYFPPRNTVVRAVAKTAPTATSAAVFVGVRPFVGLRVGTVRPRKGQQVRFMGIVNPAFDGKFVLIQRRNVNGGWGTVVAVRLFAATPGSHGPRSQYFRRVQIKRSGTFRVKFPAPAGWISNNSRTRTLRVH